MGGGVQQDRVELVAYRKCRGDDLATVPEAGWQQDPIETQELDGPLEEPIRGRVGLGFEGIGYVEVEQLQLRPLRANKSAQ